MALSNKAKAAKKNRKKSKRAQVLISKNKVKKDVPTPLLFKEDGVIYRTGPIPAIVDEFDKKFKARYFTPSED